MDKEIIAALANIRRRQKEIEAKYGKIEDDGPIFGRRVEERKHRPEGENIEELFDDLYGE